MIGNRGEGRVDQPAGGVTEPTEQAADARRRDRLDDDLKRDERERADDESRDVYPAESHVTTLSGGAGVEVERRRRRINTRAATLPATTPSANASRSAFT